MDSERVAVDAEAVEASVTVADEVASGAEAVGASEDAAVLVDVVVEDHPAVVDAGVAGAEQRRSSLSPIVTKECSSHVERRTRLSPVIWYLDQKSTARRGSQST